MEKSPLDIALERIEECKRTRAAGLDLAGLGLDHLPAEIAELTWLTALDCPFNQITDLTPLRALLLEGQLRELYVDKNPIQGIPAAITGGYDCAEALRAYWQDLAKGAANKRAIKVVLVGNGRVGKSTLAYALQHKRAPVRRLASPTALSRLSTLASLITPKPRYNASCKSLFLIPKRMMRIATNSKNASKYWHITTHSTTGQIINSTPVAKSIQKFCGNYKRQM